MLYWCTNETGKHVWKIQYEDGDFFFLSGFESPREEAQLKWDFPVEKDEKKDEKIKIIHRKHLKAYLL